MIGMTYSVAHYNEYSEKMDKNIFEEVIDKMMLDTLDPILVEKIKELPTSEKRLSILAFLDKDRNLFMKIRSFIQREKLTKIDHLKEVILMMREYVKVGEVEKKKFGEVMTPLELIKEMILTLPEEVWSNPNLKWLDPANGTGPYPLMVILKLMNGLKEWEPNEELRYKHIIENMIYVCELQPKNMFLYMCLVDPYDEYKLNIYTGSFLEEVFDKHMKEVWDLDRVDIVVGNPPYNDDVTSTGDNKLYLLFISKILNKILVDDGYLSFITPKKAIENLIDLSKNRNYVSEHKLVKYLAIDTPSRFFNVGSSFCFYTIQNKKYNGDLTTIEYYDFDKNINKTKILLYSYNKLPKFFDDLSLSILKKTVFNSDNKFNFKTMKKINGTNLRIRNKQIIDLVVKIDEDEKFKYKIIDKLKTKGITHYYIKDRMIEYDSKKVIISKGGSYPCPVYDIKGELSCSDNLLYTIIKNDLEGVNLVNFINSKLIKFLELCMTKGSDMDFSWSICNIKSVDVNKLYNDDDIFKIYGLTKNEIKLIESSLN